LFVHLLRHLVHNVASIDNGLFLQRRWVNPKGGPQDGTPRIATLDTKFFLHIWSCLGLQILAQLLMVQGNAVFIR
jgi:hypothetical protein